jgi:hypothetical protein
MEDFGAALRAAEEDGLDALLALMQTQRHDADAVQQCLNALAMHAHTFGRPYRA